MYFPFAPSRSKPPGNNVIRPQSGCERVEPQYVATSGNANRSHFARLAIQVPFRREILCSVVFFSLSSWAVALIVFALVGSVTAGGVLLGRRLRQHTETLREPFGAMQGALLGVVGLILAFGLSLAVGRYQDRRAAVVDEANAIGTTYPRAQMLAEPVRDRSLALLVQYTDQSIRLGKAVPGSAEANSIIAAENVLQR